jgi:hypothetical protein
MTNEAPFGNGYALFFLEGEIVSCGFYLHPFAPCFPSMSATQI